MFTALFALGKTVLGWVTGVGSSGPSIPPWIYLAVVAAVGYGWVQWETKNAELAQAQSAAAKWQASAEIYSSANTQLQKVNDQLRNQSTTDDKATQQNQEVATKLAASLTQAKEVLAHVKATPKECLALSDRDSSALLQLRGILNPNPTPASPRGTAGVGTPARQPPAGRRAPVVGPRPNFSAEQGRSGSPPAGAWFLGKGIAGASGDFTLVESYHSSFVQ